VVVTTHGYGLEPRATELVTPSYSGEIGVTAGYSVRLSFCGGQNRRCSEGCASNCESYGNDQCQQYFFHDTPVVNVEIVPDVAELCKS
jgi:hypothetical protein